ncbi:LysR family transcriptional regulator [Novosphingobium sp. PhB55]|uniref:LysR family transcriptional regulator n=1 Tax=unclassified Novosphingobium TaxID=2644732 RepID=UPI00106565CB|nr:LysR family transcriptional regulator [Novosphingobium sp. PhB55]TDW67587.1 LysR family transcriptional regulator [Novosphingobium sp. PhB55]
MDRFATYQLLVRVVELGSFTRAAQELGLGQPAVSKQIAALEASIGARLVERTSRGLRPTPAGLDLYNSAVRLLDDLDEIEGRVRSGNLGPAGLVRVATPPVLGRMFIIPKLSSFLSQFPEVEIEFTVAQRRVDLVKDGIDVALRVGHLKSSSLVARKIGTMQMVTVAAPSYLADHGTPLTPRELANHRLIVGQTDGAALDWQFKGDDGAFSITPSGSLRSDDGEDLRASVLAGIGLLHGPMALLYGDIQEGRVVRILEAFAPDAVPIHAVSMSGRKMPPRVRVFVDFLAATFAAEPALSP